MKKLLSGILWIGLVGLLAGSAMAAGFQINEQGTRAMGQAMAFAARADDPSAIYFNPAGITQLEGTQFYFGGTAIIGNTTWIDVDGTEIDSRDRWEFPMHMYMTHQLNEQWYFGLGVFVPYGLSKGWPDDFPGKYYSKEARLLSFCVNPTIAYKINERVSIAAGFDYYHTEGRLDRELYLQPLSDLYFGGYPLDDGYFSAIVKSDDFGWNAGIRVMLNDKWAVGASYRSQVKTDLEGDLELKVPHTGVPQIDGTLAALFPSQRASTSITLPDTAFIGIGGEVTKQYETEVDLQWSGWSDYNELPFDFSQPTPALQDTKAPKDWADTWALRWGNEFHYNDTSDIRFGMYYDSNPTPDATLDPLLPDNDRFSLQVGYGYHKGKIFFDVAYMYLYFFERDIQNNPDYHIIPSQGTYKSSANLFGFSAGYRF
jgi:long-chain fatty acid transport protein